MAALRKAMLLQFNVVYKSASALRKPDASSGYGWPRAHARPDMGARCKRELKKDF